MYTSGCIIIVEDLHDGKQRHLLHHVEEISTLALQHDVQVLASASGSSDMIASRVCIWDIQSGSCKKVKASLSYLASHSSDDMLLSGYNFTSIACEKSSSSLTLPNTAGFLL